MKNRSDFGALGLRAGHSQVMALAVLAFAIIAGVFVMPGILGSGDQGAFAASDQPGGWQYTDGNKVYTAYSETEDLGNGGKAVTIYSAQEYVREDGMLKHKTEARSLKGTDYAPVRLQDDGVHDIEYVDWNWDSVSFRVKLRDVPDASALKGLDIPLKADGIQKSSVQFSDVGILSDVVTLNFPDSVIGHNWSFGLNSTIDTIVSTNNLTFEDNPLCSGEFGNSDAHTKNYGAFVWNIISRQTPGSDYWVSMMVYQVDLGAIIGTEKTISNLSFIEYLEETIGTPQIGFGRLKVGYIIEGNQSYALGNSSFDYPNNTAPEVWTNQPAGTNTDDFKDAYVGSTYATITTLPASCGSSCGWFTYELTNADLQSDYNDDGVIQFFGNLTNGDGGTTTKYARAHSSEGTTPWKLYIEYTENTAPGISGNLTTISPYPVANDTQDLECTFTPLDAEQTGLTAFVDWYDDGDIAVQNEMAVSNGTSSTFILDAANTTMGDYWSCAVRVSDGALYSDWANSTTTGITSPPAPTEARFYFNATVSVDPVLQVNDLLRLVENASARDCNATYAGGIIYSASRHYGCDGSNWNALY
jgi:hypothetical protein